MEDQRYSKWNGRIWSGLLLLGIGTVLLLQRSGVLFPHWLFQWPMILIIVGLFVGLRHGFRGFGWLVPILIGGVFLFDIIEPDYAVRRYTFPLIIISLGLFMILRPRGNRRLRSKFRGEWSGNWQNEEQSVQSPAPDSGSQQIHTSKQDYIDSVAILGGVRKVVVSKSFRGGEVFALFGGHEVDFSQADFEGEVSLEVTQIFGGTKITLPAHWDVKSEMVAIFGGIEDKRQIPPGTTNANKILILKGTSIFGGIDIRNY